jgi:hypothetical protein
MHALRACFFSALSVVLFAPLVASAAVCPHQWQTTLKLGSTGSDVLALQQFLNTDPATAIASSGTGSSGHETGVFGGLTKLAVVRFQEKYAADILTPAGLSKGTGAVGPSTRAKLNAFCAASPAGVSVQTQSQTAAAAASLPASDSLTISDPGQPASSLVPANAGVLFLSFTLTAGSKDVTVNTITVQRGGSGTDGPFSSLALYGEDGLQIGNLASLDANHHATFRQPFTVPAGTSKRIDVYVNTPADMTAYDGQAPHLELIDITASSPVSASFPLVGTPQTVNASLTVGSASLMLSPYDPGADIKRYINSTGVRFAGIRLTADSTEDLTLSNIIWEQDGTAGPADLTNVTVVAGDTQVPAVVRGREYIGLFDPGIVIKKGNSIDIYIQGDLTATGANRTVKFNIHDNTDDISLTGNTYGFSVGASAGGNTATSGNSVFLTDTGDTDGNSLTPFYSGPQVTISPGEMISAGR